MAGLRRNLSYTAVGYIKQCHMYAYGNVRVHKQCHVSETWALRLRDRDVRFEVLGNVRVREQVCTTHIEQVFEETPEKRQVFGFICNMYMYICTRTYVRVHLALFGPAMSIKRGSSTEINKTLIILTLLFSCRISHPNLQEKCFEFSWHIPS